MRTGVCSLAGVAMRTGVSAREGVAIRTGVATREGWAERIGVAVREGTCKKRPEAEMSQQKQRNDRPHAKYRYTDKS